MATPQSRKLTSLDAAKSSGTSPTITPYEPGDALGIDAVATWLRPGVPREKGIAWVREKCRRRSPAQLPVKNLGRALLFSKIEITNWLQKLERPVHAAHPPRRRKKLAKAAA